VVRSDLSPPPPAMGKTECEVEHWGPGGGGGFRFVATAPMMRPRLRRMRAGRHLYIESGPKLGCGETEPYDLDSPDGGRRDYELTLRTCPPLPWTLVVTRAHTHGHSRRIRNWAGGRSAVEFPHCRSRGSSGWAWAAGDGGANEYFEGLWTRICVSWQFLALCCGDSGGADSEWLPCDGEGDGNGEQG